MSEDLSADLALADAEARASRERERFEAFISTSDEFTLWQLWCAALAPAVPPGFVLVPVEPTPEMVAAFQAEANFQTGDSITVDAMVHIHRALLKAAPSVKEPTCPKN